MSEEISNLVKRMFQGNLGIGRTITTSFAESQLPPEKRPRYGHLLGVTVAPPPPPPPSETAQADPDLAAADSLIDDVSAQLEPSALEALRAAPRETKLKFAKRLSNQRALRADDEAANKAKVEAEAKAACQRDHDRLASLGFALGRAERGK